MNYHNITKADMLNGDGLRVVLWVAGCNHHCPECQNPETHDAFGGIPFDANAKQEIFDELEKSYISGITFSGGDPLFPSNRETVESLIREIKEKYPTKTIWLYTGYTYERIQDLDFVKLVDVICDGRFEIDKKDNNLHWVGSSNQRIIDVQKTVEQNTVILHEVN